MGYGVPAAVAAKLLYAEKAVFSFAGDGCFRMKGLEFASAVQLGLPIGAVANNRIYGTIRMDQESDYPDRAWGGFGTKVDRTEDFLDTVYAAIDPGLPAIIKVQTSPETLSSAAHSSKAHPCREVPSDAPLSQARNRARSRRKLLEFPPATTQPIADRRYESAWLRRLWPARALNANPQASSRKAPFPYDKAIYSQSDRIENPSRHARGPAMHRDTLRQK